jgi:hypothetical protein
VLQILNLAEAAQAKMTKAAFEGSTHYVMVRWCRQQGPGSDRLRQAGDALSQHPAEVAFTATAARFQRLPCNEPRQ